MVHSRSRKRLRFSSGKRTHDSQRWVGGLPSLQPPDWLEPANWFWLGHFREREDRAAWWLWAFLQQCCRRIVDLPIAGESAGLRLSFLRPEQCKPSVQLWSGKRKRKRVAAASSELPTEFCRRNPGSSGVHFRRAAQH